MRTPGPGALHLLPATEADGVHVSAAGAVAVGVPSDGFGDAALDWATDDAGRRHRRLLLVAAAERSGHRSRVGVDSLRARAGGLPQTRLVTSLDRAQARVHLRAPAVEVATALVGAHPVAALVAAARSADCVVVGSHGRTRLGTLLLRSISQAVVSQTSCPVVVVREPPPGQACPGRPAAHPVHGRVVVGVDGSPSSSAATAFALEQAALRGSELVVVHAWRPPGEASRALPDQERWRRARAAEVAVANDGLARQHARHPGVEVRTLVLADSAVDALVFASETADLLVVGSHGWGDPSGLLLGSVCHAVLRQAECPVAVVSAQADGGHP